MARPPASRVISLRRMPALTVAASAVIVALALALSGCGGGGTTTVIEKVESHKAESAGAGKPALLKLPTYEHELVEPSTYSFVVDGSFVGAHLKWEDWGSQTTTGTGIIEERDFDGGFNDRKHYPGTVVATGLEECRGRDYYTEVSANVPPNAIYVPEETTQLTTPCRTYASIQAEAEPEAEEPESVPERSFYTPSRNIGCILTSNSVRCDIRHKTWTPPPRPSDCMLDWGHSVSAGIGETGHVLCAGDTLLTGDYGVLPYGRRISQGAMTCVSHENGLTCSGQSRDGFFLSVEELRLF
jgi:hypothetical protein